MDLRALETFVAVAEERHFGRAADRLHVVQSTVSASVRSLESELGGALFRRTTRSVELTDAGRLALPEARAALAAVDRMRGAVDDVGAGLAGLVRLGTFAAVRVLDLPSALAGFRAAHPRVEVRLGTSPTGSTGLAADLRAGRLDVAMVALPTDLLTGIEFAPVVDSPFVALVPDSHPLADRAAVSLAELQHESFVDAPAPFGHRLAIDRAFAAAGTPRAVNTEVADVPSIPLYVAAGLGVGIAPAALIAPTPGVRMPVVTDAPAWSLGFGIAPQAGAAARALFTALVQTAP